MSQLETHLIDSTMYPVHMMHAFVQPKRKGSHEVQIHPVTHAYYVVRIVRKERHAEASARWALPTHTARLHHNLSKSVVGHRYRRMKSQSRSVSLVRSFVMQFGNRKKVAASPWLVREYWRSVKGGHTTEALVDELRSRACVDRYTSS